MVDECRQTVDGRRCRPDVSADVGQVGGVVESHEAAVAAWPGKHEYKQGASIAGVEHSRHYGRDDRPHPRTAAALPANL